MFIVIFAIVGFCLIAFGAALMRFIIRVTARALMSLVWMIAVGVLLVTLCCATFFWG